MYNEDELYHSDTYLGEDYTDGIHHWKYIKRERINGKWRYYYKDDKLDSLKKISDVDSNALRAENRKRGYGDDANHYSIVGGKKVGNDPVYRKLSNDAFKSYHNYGIEKYRSDKRKKIYESTVLKALNSLSSTSHNIRNSINKGKNAIANLFKKKK